MFQHKEGQTTRQAHKGIPEGCYEEEQGLKGFFGPVSHLIKRAPSTGWVEIEGPLRPHMYDPQKFGSADGNVRMLYNSAVTLSMEFMSPKKPGELKARRNADGDLIYFCHTGGGDLLTEYGALTFKKGHYIVVPKCLTYCFALAEKSAFFVIENRTSHFEQPERGLVGRHAIYELLQTKLKEWGAIKEVRVKRQDEVTKFRYSTCVMGDVVGWKGDLFPFTLHVDDMMPLMSHRAHLPPSAHTTFVARDFVVCTFLPRPLESDEDALKVPFYHQNIDYDEVLFYHAGDFFSRDNLHAGMMSLHPAGFPHGPHPKAVKSSQAKTETNEYAVMVDTRQPLSMDERLLEVELKDYWKSWKA